MTDDGSASANSWVLRYNEFVLMNQVIVAGSLLSNLVVFAIIVAGILVGVMTYPSMSPSDDDMTPDPAVVKYLDAIDLAVQCVFQADVAFKILQEGTNPLNYWCDATTSLPPPTVLQAPSVERGP